MESQQEVKVCRRAQVTAAVTWLNLFRQLIGARARGAELVL